MIYKLQCDNCSAILPWDPDDEGSYEIKCSHCNTTYLRDDLAAKLALLKRNHVKQLRHKLTAAVAANDLTTQYLCCKDLAEITNEPEYLLYNAVFNVLLGANITKAIENNIKDNLEEIGAFSDELPDSGEIAGKPFSSILLKDLIKALRDPDTSDRESMTMARYSPPPGFFWVIAIAGGIVTITVSPFILIALIIFMLLWEVLSTSAGIFRFRGVVHGPNPNVKLLIFQDGMLIIPKGKRYKPDKFPYEVISRVDLFANNTLHFFFKQSGITLTISCPDADSDEIHKMLSFVRTKIK